MSVNNIYYYISKLVIGAIGFALFVQPYHITLSQAIGAGVVLGSLILGENDE